jgi:hypothetical protein
MPVETVSGTAITDYRIAFDAAGRERHDDVRGLMSRRAIDTTRDPGVTDVFLIGHGGRGDLAAARSRMASGSDPWRAVRRT